MHNEFTASVEQEGKWFGAYSPEIPERAEKG